MKALDKYSGSRLGNRQINEVTLFSLNFFAFLIYLLWSSWFPLDRDFYL